MPYACSTSFVHLPRLGSGRCCTLLLLLLLLFLRLQPRLLLLMTPANLRIISNATGGSHHAWAEVSSDVHNLFVPQQLILPLQCELCVRGYLHDDAAMSHTGYPP